MFGDKNVTNAYGVLDNELKRLYSLLDSYRKTDSADNVTTIWGRITMIQDTLLELVKLSDAEIQNKIAELALMGKEE